MKQDVFEHWRLWHSRSSLSNKFDVPIVNRIRHAFATATLSSTPSQKRHPLLWMPIVLILPQVSMRTEEIRLPETHALHESAPLEASRSCNSCASYKHNHHLVDLLNRGLLGRAQDLTNCQLIQAPSPSFTCTPLGHNAGVSTGRILHLWDSLVCNERAERLPAPPCAVRCLVSPPTEPRRWDQPMMQACSIQIPQC